MFVNSTSNTNSPSSDYNYWGVGGFYLSLITVVLILILVIFGYHAIFVKKEHQHQVDLEKIQAQAHPPLYQLRFY